MNSSGQNQSITNNLDGSPFSRLDSFIDAMLANGGRDERDAVLIRVLHEAQNIFGYLPPDVQEFVAEKLCLSLSRVLGVISFYQCFTTERRGRYRVEFCLGTACFVRGAEEVVERFRTELGIGLGDIDEDGLFSLDSLRCVGACSLAPVVMVNGKVYGNVKPAQVPDIIAGHASSSD